MSGLLQECSEWPDFLKEIYSQKERGDSEHKSLIKELFNPVPKPVTSLEIRQTRMNPEFIFSKNSSKILLIPVLASPSPGLPLEPVGRNIEVRFKERINVEFDKKSFRKVFK